MSPRRSLALGLALLALTVHGAGAAEEPDSPPLPMRFDRVLAPFPVVQVRLNGGAPAPFLLDTGFNGQLLIDRKAAERLKLPTGGRTVTLRPGNLEFTEVVLDKVELTDGKRDVDLGVRTAHIGDLSGLQRGFDAGPWGVIGAQALRRKILRLDFAAQTLTLLSQAHPGAASVSLPLTEVASDAWRVALPMGEGVVADLQVDTGSGFSTLPEPVAARLHPKAITSFIHSDVEKNVLHVSAKLLLGTLAVGPFELRELAFSSGSARDALLGTDFLSRFLVTLDLRGKHLFLERPSVRGALVGATGLHIAPGSYEVTFVDAGSPAAKAGMKVGDRLVAVDGRRLPGLQPIVAQRALASFAGETARLELERGGRALSVSFTRPSEFDLPVGALRGVGLDKKLDGNAVVTSVAPGTPAAKAGLRVGDVVLSVNGVSVATLRSGELGYLLMQPEAALTVSRDNTAAALSLLLRIE